MKFKFFIFFTLHPALFFHLAYGGVWLKLPFPSPDPIKPKSLMNMSSYQPPSGSTVLLGRGFNSITGKIAGPCVESGPLETLKSNPSNTTGQKVTYAMQELETVNDLQEQLEVGIGGSLGLGIWGLDAKSKYYRNNTFNKKNYYLLLRVSVENQTEILKDYKLTNSATEFYSRFGKEAFLESCGDQFVAGRVTGGEFIAILEIETGSIDQKKSVSAQINASGLYWNLNSNLSTTLATISKLNRTSITVFRAGDSGNLPPQNPAQLIEYALTFPSKVSNLSGGAWPIMVNTEDYSVVLDKPFTEVIHLDEQRRTLVMLATAQEKAKSLLSDIGYALAHQNEFAIDNLDPLLSTRKILQNNLKEIKKAASDCADHLLQGCQVPEMAWPEFELPPRRSAIDCDDWDPEVWGFYNT